MNSVKIAPSILSADFARMGEEVATLKECGADFVHVDVMDGVFVPNITFGIKMVEDIRKYTDLPLDVHLMIVEPWKYVERFAKAGADLLTFHLESNSDPDAVLDKIIQCGKRTGLAINPDTPFERVIPYLDRLDLLLVMTIFPGFGGQKLMPETLTKVQQAVAYRAEKGLHYRIEVDGGVNADTAAMVAKAGAEILVAGSAVFGKADYAAAIAAIRDAAR